ncbi:MAG: hypothetical protein Q8Q09_16745 [Deltaproteobacteria bacterium]|nr:hypothetical protein [Deltaproteobacteria bacterium]
MAAQTSAVNAAGGLLVEVLTEGLPGAPTRANLDAWVGNHMLQLTTVMDVAPSRRAFMVLGRREISYIVDLRTMRIVRRALGDTGGAVNPPPIRAEIERMLTLLRMG